MEMYEFIENCKNKHLTLDDIEKLNVGDTLDVVIWDINFEEYWIWQNAKQGINYNPKDFFASNHHCIEYLGNYKWDVNFNFGETFTHPIHLDVSSMNTNWTWCPLENDRTKISHEMLNISDEFTPNKKAPQKHITEFDKNTRVGWRGPIMLWNELNNLSNVYLDTIY